jgi:phosphonate ABC transporter permease subunit PhnE
LAQTQDTPKKLSTLHGVLSLVIPGLGQMVAGKLQRGFSILISVIVLFLLSVWTIAQKARFPEEYYSAGTKVLSILVLESVALIIFLLALRYLLARFIMRDATSQAFSVAGFAALYAVAVLFLTNPLLQTAASSEILRRLNGQTAVFAAAALAAYWLWQALDAARLGAGEGERSMSVGILLSLLLIFSLGWNITQINLGKAISEYRDTQVILGRIFWPWRAAFEFEQITDEAIVRIQAPCPEGTIGPEQGLPLEDGVWISVTPTCGDLSERDLVGNFELGTELTIIGGGYEAGQEVEIFWKNPIGNAFQPRSVGETTILIDEDGEFETKLFIPVIATPSTAVGAQLHTLIVRQESEVVFTGNMSREMQLALANMLVTIMLALMATFFGIIFAFPVSFLAARNLMEPISSPLRRVLGGLFGLMPALWIAAKLTSLAASAFGGLERAPIPIALIGLFLVLGLGYMGFSWGGRLTSVFNRRMAERSLNWLMATVAALLATLPGWIVGLGVTFGIISIPLGAEAVASKTLSLPFPIITGIESGLSFSSTPSLASGVAFLGAVLFAVFAFIWALRVGANNEVKIGMLVYGITRLLMNIVRSIEPLIWAIVGVIWVGLGPFAGMIALTLHTIAALGKLYSESIESIDSGPIEAIQATGATRLQTIVYAVVPQILPPFISFTIYRWDINVRLSTIIGLVGGGGIGFLLIQWIRQFQYSNAGLAVWLITITVASLDYISSNIRKRFV